MNKLQKQDNKHKKTKFLLDHNFHKTFLVITGGKSNYLYLADKHIIFDISSGATISYLGYNNKKVINTITNQMNTSILYLYFSFWISRFTKEFYKKLINGTGRQIDRVYLISSGLFLFKYFSQMYS
jgi:adenosylmethionine-8-amino-7-oxononanoate aminotransferase